MYVKLKRIEIAFVKYLQSENCWYILSDGYSILQYRGLQKAESGAGEFLCRKNLKIFVRIFISMGIM